jgi:MFS family permease
MSTLKPAQLWLRIFVPFAVGYFLSYLLRNVNAVIAPELVRELNFSAADLGLLTSAYLAVFGAFQLPLGILLDRYGPRRVEATLLVIAAIGATLFALGGTLTELAFARALIGLGVSACLMASFKAFSMWFPMERQASLNSAIMAAGGLGALTSSTPLSWSLSLIGWRGAFFGLAVLAMIAAILISTTPDKSATASKESLLEQLRGVGKVFACFAFWRYAPQTALIGGGFMAMQGLWAVPWLMNFNGLTRDAAAFHLLLMSLGMMIGFVAIAAFVTRLAARGIKPEHILITGMGGGMIIALLIVIDGAPTHLLWFVMGLVFSISNLSYALLTAKFPMQLAGRANTTLNLFLFIGAFVIQWGFGAAVDGFTAGGMSPHAAYQRTYAILLALQALSYGWYILAGRRRPRT